MHFYCAGIKLHTCECDGAIPATAKSAESTSPGAWARAITPATAKAALAGAPVLTFGANEGKTR
jgi:hypothetical protein